MQHIPGPTNHVRLSHSMIVFDKSLEFIDITGTELYDFFKFGPNMYIKSHVFIYHFIK